MENRMSEQGLEHLEAWKMAKDFTLSVYRNAIPCLPNEEKWGLSNQLRRAAQSIPANIAEGYGRYYFLENVRFCYIARGSLEETFSHLVLAHELGYLPAEIFNPLSEKYQNLLRLLNGYIAYLKKSRKGEDEISQSMVRDETSQPYFSDLIEDESEI
jgi:four helix bundle protein